MRTNWCAMAALAAGVGLVSLQNVRADDKPQHDTDLLDRTSAEAPMGMHEGTMPMGESMEMHEGMMPMETHMDVPEDEGQPEAMPATAGNLWQRIMADEARIEAMLADGKLDQVRDIADEMRRLLLALTGKSAALPADKLVAIAGATKTAAGAATRLNEASDTGDMTASADAFSTLKDALRGIETLYPDAMLKPEASGEDAPADAAVYTCPMHPDVTAREPGRCPRCGMKLEPKS